MSTTCVCCSKLIIKDEVSVSCGVCKQIYKATCVELSRSEAKKINSNCGLFWSCKNCRKISGELVELKAVIASLQEDIKALKSMAQTSESSYSTAVKTEEIIQEVLQREQRKNNIVVHGLAENVSKVRSDRILADQAAIQDVFDAIGINVVEFKHQRLGKFDPTKSENKRPIKDSLLSNNVVIDALKKSKALKETTNPSKIFITRDRTPFEQKLYNSARNELLERRSRGEQNIRIRFKNGIPQIVMDLN
ncbi:hypothetical protein QE152_g285 [Popillia japonica]|uniref:PHD-type domain-containing protein n=1 Tax=Popillia japonica TaxID=7064 RepID=A0AAW1NFA7_POPJA